ncbi:MAG: Gfo/Idh/MocA family protein [Chloroflexota bacterium]
MTDPIRIGVIGAGQIGKHHLKTYAEKVPGVQVVAVADLNETEARRVADMHAIPDVYGDFRQLLQRDDIVAVDVCLHNNLHAPVAVAAMRAGKHVYCEKPLAGSLIDAEEMVETARATGCMLHMQLSTLYSKEVRAARYLIDAGKLGRIYHARSIGHRRRGRPFVDGYGTCNFVQKEVSAGGALYDMGVYNIAAMLYLLGNPDVLTITGQTYQEIPMDPERQASSCYDVEELGLGFVRLTNNVSLDVFEAWAYHMDMIEGSSVAGSEGGVKLKPFGYYFNVGDLSLDATANLESFAWRRGAIRANADAEEGSQQHWAAALQGRVPLLPTAELGLKTMLISEGIYLSGQLGREVTPADVRAASKSTAIRL